MPVTFVASNSGTPNQGNSPALSQTSVVTKPTGLAVGDVMVTMVLTNAGGTVTAPSVRWTQLYTKDGTATGPFRSQVWYCVATSSETAATSFTWTNVDAAGPTWAATAAYRGVDQNNPINASNFSITGTTNPQTTPSITSTYKSMILYLRGVRRASTTAQSFSGSQTERFDDGNHGSTIGYSGQLQDSNGEVASGSISGTAVTYSTTLTDSVSYTIALTSADVSAPAARAQATAAAYNAQALTGQSVTAGLATATVSVKTVSVFAGKVVNTVGVAATTAAVPDVGRTVRPTTATAVGGASNPMLFFGTPGFRLKQVPAENRTLPVGTDRENGSDT